ncbi:unnamed protein product [Hymenolepis diminuta]|uniref:BTB domain-containing protein n=3 Tax=Hymenolepis diminuta TaxID=6216 RepID=A0A158QDB8_HYMDI|nr:unnamed protein product [Hymenolepis diminuta]
MSNEFTYNPNPYSGEDELPAKNMAAAKNRQRSPSLLNENFANASGLLTSSPLYFDWQSNRFCVSERVRSLFANTMLADVYFNIHYRPGCDGAATPFIQSKHSQNQSSSPPEVLVQRIPAHAFILAISSAVFEAMFYGPMSIQNAGRSAPAVTVDQSATKSTGQAMVKQTSWPPPSSSASNLSPSEHMPIDSADDLNLLDKETHRQPLIFNPSSSQINPNNPIEVHVNDVNPVAFINMLRFIYTDEIQIDASNVLQTLFVAKKYAINIMEKACVEFLSQSITVDNAFMLLSHANFFDEQELAQKCLEVIDKNTSRVFDTEDFLTADKDLLLSVLERDTLCIRESRLFTSILKWAKAEYHRRTGTENVNLGPSSAETPRISTSSPQSPSSNSLSRPNIAVSQVTQLPNLSDVPQDSLREIMQPILPHIRFPQMNIEEFANLVVPSGVLDDAMTVKIFQHFIVAKSVKPELPFVKRPRCYQHDAEEVVQRFVLVDQRWDYRGTSDRIRFKVDRKIHLVGFGLYGSIHGESEYEASIELVQPETGVVLGSNMVTYLSDGSPNTCRVAFKEPITLKPNVNYLASATIKGQDSYYGTGGRRKISHECRAGGKVTFQFSYAACMNNGTSVEDGQIPEIIFFV